jgi:hypothetical protein
MDTADMVTSHYAHPSPSHGRRVQETHITHAGDAYEQGYDAGAAGLPADLTGLDSMETSIYLTGYADASGEVIRVLSARLLTGAARAEAVAFSIEGAVWYCQNNPDDPLAKAAPTTKEASHE